MRKKAYVYLRVSTYIQVEGKSLEGQLKEIEAYCQAYNIEIISVYSDEGKSGKSIQGRPQFQKLLKDIEEKEDVDYVIVWKLSRFGRNARETLNSLELLQKHHCNLIAKEDRLDSSDKNGRFIITLLSAMAEMERENIIEQTNNGKKYNALSGNWNGGKPPYGYDLKDGKLVVNKEESEIVRKIFDWYISDESIGYNGVTAKLNENGIKPRQEPRLDRKAMEASGSDEKIYLPTVTSWYTSAVKQILDHPVYCGKLRWGNSKAIMEAGRTKRVRNENGILVDGNHEAIITEEVYRKAQIKRKATGKQFYDRKNGKESPHNLLSQLARCPQCGRGMIASSSQYKKACGDHIVYYSYICGYYNNHKHGECSKNPINAEYLEGEVIDTIKGYLKRPNIIEEITEYFSTQLDTSKIKGEIEMLEKEMETLARNEQMQYDIISQIGIEGRYKNWSLEKVEQSIEKIIVKRMELEQRLQEKQSELSAIEQEILNAESIKYIIEHFEQAYAKAPKQEQKQLLRSLIKEVKLGYDEGSEKLGKKKVVPKSLVLKFTGEQLEIVNENLGLHGLKKVHAKTVACPKQRLGGRVVCRTYGIEPGLFQSFHPPVFIIVISCRSQNPLVMVNACSPQLHRPAVHPQAMAGIHGKFPDAGSNGSLIQKLLPVQNGHTDRI